MYLDCQELSCNNTHDRKSNLFLHYATDAEMQATFSTQHPPLPQRQYFVHNTYIKLTHANLINHLRFPHHHYHHPNFRVTQSFPRATKPPRWIHAYASRMKKICWA
jgi:hypothetical protein